MYADTIGRTRTCTDRVRPPLPRDLAAALDRPTSEALSPLWHRVLFQDRRRPRESEPDGDPSRGGFSPPVPPVHDLPRRMWASGCVRFHGGSTSRAGEEVTHSGVLTDASAVKTRVSPVPPSPKSGTRCIAARTAPW